MNRARLRFSTEIVRRLGEELNPSLDRGVLELVKNAYDADATECRVQLLNANEAGGTVTVTDNGDGMTVNDIVEGWLVLGKSTKTQSQHTRLGRIPAGSKGLGRLAALRMGTRALLTTRSRAEADKEHGLLIDWEEFDAANLVEDIELTVETSRREPELESGTQIRIEALRTGFGRMSVKRLARELVLLADPFGDDPEGFRPELSVAEYADLETLVRSRYFRDAEYHLRAEVDASGLASAWVKDWRGANLFEAKHSEVFGHRGRGRYASPAATFDLWVFILNRGTFSTRGSTVADVRNWLREFGGVHFYYNGLRVSPYGNPSDDWLGMNLRRVRSPEERPGTNTSIGRIDVTDREAVLVQKTDRSGFIENESFTELRSFALDAMEWMANQRMQEAEKRRARERVAASGRVEAAKQRLQEALAAVPGGARAVMSKALESYESSRDREAGLLRKDVQLYRTLSTAGITAATFAHESRGNPIKVIAQSIETIARRGKKLMGDSYEDAVGRPVDGIRRAMRTLSVLGTATLRLIDHDKRRVSRVDLHKVVVDVLDTYRPFLHGRDVEVQAGLASGRPYLRGSEAAVESVVVNLLANCLNAFEAQGTLVRLIKLSTTIEDGRWSLVVEDNGPGLQGITKNDIWLPGRTTRKNGTGLGLTIVRDAVKDLGGTVEAVENGPLGGAAIFVELPILGA